MNLVQLKTKAAEIYINPEHVALVSPHAQIIGSSNITLPSGLTFEVEGTTHEIRNALEKGRILS